LTYIFVHPSLLQILTFAPCLAWFVHPSFKQIFRQLFVAPFVGSSLSSSSFGCAFRFFDADAFLFAPSVVVGDVPSSSDGV
jgi:hypothetical protein